MTLPSIIAIDGPAASGKTTIGFMLAEKLGYLFLDTGSMYRAVTLAALLSGVDINAEDEVTALARRAAIDVLPRGAAADGRLGTVLLDGEDVTWALRSADVDRYVSQVSAYASVRVEMVHRQRALGRQGRVVMVGRDIGTVVMPDAPLKLYVVASAAERARRRWLERRERQDAASYDEILADIERRDQFDSRRVHSPLKAAADAIFLDSTGRTPDQLLDFIWRDLLHGLDSDADPDAPSDQSSG